MLRPGGIAPRQTGEWDSPRPPERPRPAQRPPLRPVPDLPEPTLQLDPASFFEPEHPLVRSGTAAARYQPPEVSNQARFHPRLVAHEPELVRAAAGDSSNGVGRPRATPPSSMHASATPPPASSGPQDSYSSPVYKPAPGFGPSAPPPRSPRPEPPAPPVSAPPLSGPPQKPGRFGKKGRKGDNPAAAHPAPPAASLPAQPKKEKKEEKAGLFKLKGKEQKAPTLPPPSVVPSRPATPPRPKFNAPYNYIPPGSTPAPIRPTQSSYPKAQPSSGSRTWQPPASFSPPAAPPSFRPPIAPSFSSWGPQGSDPAPEPKRPSEPPAPQVSDPAPPPGEAFAPAGDQGTQRNGNNGHLPQQEPGQDAGLWLFGASNGAPRKDPELPAFIELSMFQDPTSADDIAAEGGVEEEAEIQDAQGWTANEAWPSPVTGRPEPEPTLAWSMEPEPVEEPSLGSDKWFQTDPAAGQQPAQDWTSTETPWPGETRRPAEPTFWGEQAPPEGRPSPTIPPQAEEPPPEQHRSQAPPADPWHQDRSHPAPFEAPRPQDDRKQAAHYPSDPRQQNDLDHQGAQYPSDPPGDDLDRRAAPYPSDDSWQREAHGRQAPPSVEPRRGSRFRRRNQPERPAFDPRRQQGEFPPPEDDLWSRRPISGQEAQPAAADSWSRDQAAAVSQRDSLWATDPRLAQPPAPPPAAPGPAEEDWKPRRVDLNLEEELAAADSIAKAAARLKAAETAIKVDNGLAYVLVDDEGRPVLR